MTGTERKTLPRIDIAGARAGTGKTTGLVRSTIAEVIWNARNGNAESMLNDTDRHATTIGRKQSDRVRSRSIGGYNDSGRSGRSSESFDIARRST